MKFLVFHYRHDNPVQESRTCLPFRSFMVSIEVFAMVTSNNLTNRFWHDQPTAVFTTHRFQSSWLIDRGAALARKYWQRPGGIDFGK